MNVEELGTITPGQLQDFITCPLLFKYKYLEKPVIPSTGKDWLTSKIKESFLDIALSHQMSPSENKITPKDQSTIFVDSFTKSFNHHFDPCGAEVHLHWNHYSHEGSLHYGQKCVELMANHPKMMDFRFRDTDRVIDLHLRADPHQCTFVPCSTKTADSVLIRCSFDGILMDQTILHFSTSSRLQETEMFESKICFSLLSLAKNQMSGYSINHSNQFTILNLVKGGEPKIQWLTLEKDRKDHEFALHYIFDCCHQMNHSQFQPRENYSCLSHCSYKPNCGLFLKKVRC